ncbi:MAG: HAD hydrolase-like protein [Desulfurococcales archaeon]|nr:HAD hydrolase-like protein [Desulfurococcales archaeon]
MNTLVIFDFDGVIVNSYKGVQVFYNQFAKENKLIDPNILMYYEILYYEALGQPHYIWWPRVLKMLDISLREEVLDQLFIDYWYLRIKYSKLIEGIVKVLVKLREYSALVIICGSDDIIGLKKLRIELANVADFFNRIIVAGEDMDDYINAVSTIMSSSAYNKVYIINDKPEVLMYIKSYFPKIKAILAQFIDYFIDTVIYKHPFQPDIIVRNPSELLKIIPG